MTNKTAKDTNTYTKIHDIPITCGENIIPIDDATFSRPPFVKAFQIIMDFDSGKLWMVSIDDKNEYGISNFWKVHKSILENGIPTKIEMYTYFQKEKLEEFLRFIKSNFNFNLKGKAIPSVFHVALKKDKTKIYLWDYNKEYSGIGYGYQHELTEVFSHRNELYLIRVYRLVKPKENDYFKVELTYQRSSKKKSVRSVYALNKLYSLIEIARKIETTFEPTQNDNDHSWGSTSIKYFIESVEKALAEQPTLKIKSPNQTELFKETT